MNLMSANQYNIFYARLVNVQGESASNAIYKTNNSAYNNINNYRYNTCVTLSRDSR